MKPNSSLRSFLLAGSLLASPITYAATYYWDSNGTTGGWGTAVGGTWAEPTASRWTTGTNSTTATDASRTIQLADSVNFGDGSANTLTGGTITVSGTVDATAITFGSSAGQIILDTGIINLAAAASITVNNATDTISSEISGAGTSLTKSGTGILVLTGANSYTGSTIINAGTIDLGGGTANGSLASTALVLGGGSLNYTRTGTNSEVFTTTSITGNSIITGAAGNTLELGTVTRTGTGNRFYNFGGTGLGTISAETASHDASGIMAGFTVGDSWAVANGTGVAISGLAGGFYTKTSTFSTTAASYNAANVDVDNDAGAMDAAITANTLRFSSAAANTLTLAATNNTITAGILVGSGVGNNLSTITGGNLWSTASKDLAIIQNNTSNDLTISSAIVNNTSTSVTKYGAGRLILGGNNTFTGGLLIHEGTVALDNAGALNSTSANGVTFGMGSTGTLALNGVSAVLRNLDSNATLAGTTFVENANSTAATLTIGNSANTASTYNGTVRDGTGGGALKLVKAGTGTLILGGNNSFSGGFEIGAGTVQYDSASNANIWGAAGNIITFTGNASLHNNNNAYTLARGIAINGVTATLTGAFGESTNVTGAVTGTGTLNVTGFSNGWAATLSNTGNTFTGAVGVYGGSGTASLSVASLGNSANAITLGTGSNGAGTFTYTGSAAFSRALALGGTTSGGTFNSSGTGVITIDSNLSITNNGAKTLTLGGSNTGANTFSGSIGNSGAGATAITKADGGTWVLSNTANSYTGATTITGGTLRVSTLADGGNNSNIGASTNAAGSLILNGGTLHYTGAAVDTDRLFSLQSSGSINSSGTGAINFTNSGAMGFNGGTAAKTLTLTGTNTGDNKIAASIGNLTAATSIAKTGIGRWILSGNNSMTGTSSISGGGTLVLDYTTQDNAKLASGALTLGGGTIVLKGGTNTTQAVSSIAFSGNAGTFFMRDTGTAKINLNSSPTGFTSVVSFSHDNMATTDKTNVAGILGAWYTVGDRWATNATNAGDGNIVGYTGGTAFTPGSAVDQDVNYDLAGGGALTATRLVNTLRIESTADNQILDIGGNNLQTSNLTGTGALTNTSGGLLYVGGGFDQYTITGTGRFYGENNNGQGFLINVYSGTLILNAILGNGSSPFMKSGEGTLVLGKDNSTSITGEFRVYQGVVRATNSGGLGAMSVGAIVQNGATIELTNGIAVGAKALNITGTGVSNGGALRNVATTTSSYAGAITIGSGGARINSDSGTLTLSGGVVTNGNTVTFGGAGNTTVSTAAISGPGGLIKDGAETTTLTTTNTYTGATNVNSGTLAITGTGSINTTSAINVAASGTLRYDSSTALTVAPTVNGSGVSNRAVLGGAGPINAAVTLNNLGDVLSPGNSPGIQSYTGGQSWASFSYDWEVNDFSDVTGLTAGSDFDQIGITGTLDLTGGSGSYILNVLGLTAGNVAGSVPNFSEINRSWTILTSSGLSGFNVANWTINTTGFTDPDTGAWALAQSDNNLVLSYTVVPEPRAALLGGLGMLMLLRRRKR